MSQDHQLIPLSIAHRTPPPSTEAKRCDLYDPAEKRHRPFFFLGIDESKPH